MNETRHALRRKYLDFDMYLDLDGIQPLCISYRMDPDDTPCAEPLSCGAADGRYRDRKDAGAA